MSKQPTPDSNDADTTYRFFLEQLKGTVQAPASSRRVGSFKESRSIPERVEEERVRREKIENDNKEKDQRLKEMTLKQLFVFLGIETAIVFVVAFLQGFKLLGFHLDEWSLRLLLAATLVQTVSMLTIAIRHLFPQKNGA